MHGYTVKTAFLQGQPIDRDVYIKPPKEADVSEGYVWKLNKCVYGLSDASLSWYNRVRALMVECGATVSKVDPAVFYWVDSSDQVYGILACHVDDFIWGGDQEFEDIISKIKSTFKVGKESDNSFKYCGIDLLCDDNVIYLSQDSYTDGLSVIDITATRSVDKSAKLTAEEGHVLRSTVL